VNYDLRLTETLSVVELDPGDSLTITMINGESRNLSLRSAGANVRLRGRLPYRDAEGVILYRIQCCFELDGHQVNLTRNIPSQDNFRDPPSFMGLRVWLDATRDISDFLGQHGSSDKCFPKKQCRLVIWDASQRICPPMIHPWCPVPEDTLRIEQCYRGEDTWMGPYDGNECHGGLDINHPAGTPLWTPISIHEHELFHRVGRDGANNNRWRGWHHWPDGKSWFLQSHHIIRLVVDEGTPIEAGVRYAEGAGVLSACHEHSHFVFGVRNEAHEEMLIDPWLLFWQMYEDRRTTSR
jgi:hypothetical protein